MSSNSEAPEGYHAFFIKKFPSGFQVWVEVAALEDGKVKPGFQGRTHEARTIPAEDVPAEARSAFEGLLKLFQPTPETAVAGETTN